MTTNIFDDLPQQLPMEVVQTLIRAADVRIERLQRLPEQTLPAQPAMRPSRT